MGPAPPTSAVSPAFTPLRATASCGTGRRLVGRYDVGYSAMSSAQSSGLSDWKVRIMSTER